MRFWAGPLFSRSDKRTKKRLWEGPLFPIQKNVKKKKTALGGPGGHFPKPQAADSPARVVVSLHKTHQGSPTSKHTFLDFGKASIQSRTSPEPPGPQDGVACPPPRQKKIMVKGALFWGAF